MKREPVIFAATVNHNTSAFTELMLRSLFATHPKLPNLFIRVFDNQSTDDTAFLRAYTAQMNIPIEQSGFSTHTANNSHGEVLRSFVMANRACDYYLFLDADVVFIQPDTIPGILNELKAAPLAFGAGPRLSWDGIHPLPENDDNPDIYAARLHPCCALIKNTPLFQTVVEEVGLFCAKLLWAERDEYLDTFKLMTKVMKTHGQHHIITAQMIMHFFTVSYEWDPVEIQQIKRQRRDELLASYRAVQK